MKKVIEINYSTSYRTHGITYVCDFNYKTAEMMCHPDINIAKNLIAYDDNSISVVYQQARKIFPTAKIELIEI